MCFWGYVIKSDMYTKMANAFRGSLTEWRNEGNYSGMKPLAMYVHTALLLVLYNNSIPRCKEPFGPFYSSLSEPIAAWACLLLHSVNGSKQLSLNNNSPDAMGLLGVIKLYNSQFYFFCPQYKRLKFLQTNPNSFVTAALIAKKYIRLQCGNKKSLI